MEISKRDWKLFQEKLPGWQEAFMERLTAEYMELLSSNMQGSEKFWALEKRIKEDRKKAGVRLFMVKSDMIHHLIMLAGEGAITADDLSEFSEDIQNTVKDFVRAQNGGK